jgi:hypothetical protein
MPIAPKYAWQIGACEHTVDVRATRTARAQESSRIEAQRIANHRLRDIDEIGAAIHASIVQMDACAIAHSGIVLFL